MHRFILLVIVTLVVGCRTTQHTCDKPKLPPVFKMELEVGYQHIESPNDRVDVKVKFTGR
jgi:hypothetical protein